MIGDCCLPREKWTGCGAERACRVPVEGRAGRSHDHGRHRRLDGVGRIRRRRLHQRCVRRRWCRCLSFCRLRLVSHLLLVSVVGCADVSGRAAAGLMLDADMVIGRVVDGRMSLGDYYVGRTREVWPTPPTRHTRVDRAWTHRKNASSLPGYLSLVHTYFYLYFPRSGARRGCAWTRTARRRTTSCRSWPSTPAGSRTHTHTGHTRAHTHKPTCTHTVLHTQRGTDDLLAWTGAQADGATTIEFTRCGPPRRPNHAHRHTHPQTRTRARARLQQTIHTRAMST